MTTKESGSPKKNKLKPPKVSKGKVLKCPQINTDDPEEESSRYSFSRPTKSSENSENNDSESGDYDHIRI